MSDPNVAGWQPGRPLNKAALAAIYDQFHIIIYRYIYRQLGDVETARDLAADVFRRLLSSAQQGTGPRDNVRAWLYQTAHNLLVDYYRRQKHRMHLPLQDDRIEAKDNPVVSAEFHISVQKVRAALTVLTPDQRQVIVLKYVEGLSNAEVAAVIGKPVGAVKSLQHRALEALRRQLAPAEERVPL